jgi:inorganic triphosphatase YgiF
MAKEVELKLSLPEYAVPAIMALSDQACLPLGNSQGEPLILDNQYFDTDDLALNQSHAALRIRKSQYGYKQTLKNKGQAIGGLHQRGEWEYNIDQPEIDWSLFPAELNVDPELKDAIKPLFKTDFNRHVWIKKFGDSEIELVLDQGSIHNGHKRTPLCEIELELMSGQAEDLFGFAHELAGQLPLVPCDINKAERGYGLESNISFYNAPDFSGQLENDLDINAFLQDALTRINRHWDRFGQTTDWWSLLVLSRHVQAVEFVLSCLIRSDAKLSTELQPVLSSWHALQKQMSALLAPARVVIALFVDDHSNSRGLSQRLLQNLTGSLNDKILQWMNQNALGQSLLLLGDFLYRHGPSLNELGDVRDVLWQPLTQLKERSLDMPVQQFQDLQSIQTLAYFYKRFNHESYALVNSLIRQHLVVMGMTDAMSICVIKDDDSRAKLSSWVRRLTVEQRRLQACREQLKDKILA